MTALQAAMLAGLGVGTGLVLLLLARSAPAPALSAAMANLEPDAAAPAPAAADGAAARLGAWLSRTFPALARGRARPADLDLLGIDPARHAGEKVLGAAAGLAAPTLITAAAGLLGLRLPAAVPLAAGAVFAVLLLLAADAGVARRAAAARVEVRRALAAYADLISLERASGSGASEAMEAAAGAAPNWVFRRIHGDLVRARLGGRSPWDALAGLGGRIGVPELSDLAGVMRLAGEESTSVTDTLRATAAGLRTALAEDAHAAANAAMQQMMLPLAGLALIYLVLLALPGVLNVVSTL
jgi:hypothetical protein